MIRWDIPDQDFLACGKAGRFTAAARDAPIVQSAMSSAVAQLSEISRLHLYRPERHADRRGRPRAPASGLPDLARVLSNVRERRLDFVINCTSPRTAQCGSCNQPMAGSMDIAPSLAPPNMSPINRRAESLRVSGRWPAPLPRRPTRVKDRIPAASVTVTCRHGARYRGAYRLATACLLLAPTRSRADELASRALGTRDRLSHAAAYLLPGQGPRSDDLLGLEQEIWTLLALCHQQRVPAGSRVTAG